MKRRTSFSRGMLAGLTVVTAVIVGGVGLSFAIALVGSDGAEQRPTPPPGIPTPPPGVLPPRDAPQPATPPTDSRPPVLDLPQPPPPPLAPVGPQFDEHGNEIFMPGPEGIAGGKTYRIGLGDWLVDIPAGASLQLGVAVRSGPVGGGTRYIFEHPTGSMLFINAATGEETGRRITESGRQEGVSATFDRVAGSMRPVR